MDIKKLNSLTKYPSILTYHRLGEKGRLTESLTEESGYLHESELVYLYEKVDGENARTIFFKTDKGEVDYLIGSREELLYAKGDRIGNPYGNIADFLKPIAENLQNRIFSGNDWALTVIYQESYGGKTKAAKNYTASKTQHYRFFDVFSISKAELDQLLAMPQEKIAEWRDHGRQPFYKEEEKTAFAQRLELDAAPLLAEKPGLDFPRTIADTYAYLKEFEHTQVGMDAAGRSEGIIARSSDRKHIRKIRFEDYERTLRSS